MLLGATGGPGRTGRWAIVSRQVRDGADVPDRAAAPGIPSMSWNRQGAAASRQGAFPAGLVPEEVQVVAHDVDDAVAIVHHQDR